MKISKSSWRYYAAPFILSSLSFFSFNAFAAAQPAINFMLGGGLMDAGDHNSIVFPSDSFRVDRFDTSDQNFNVAAALGLSYTVQPAADKFNTFLADVTLATNVYYNRGSFEGDVWEYSLSEFNNSTYEMVLQTVRVMFDAEFNFMPWQKVTPFLQLGVGLAANGMSFDNYPGVEGGSYSLPDYGYLQFAYEVGAGLKTTVHKNIVLSARYLYANSGKAESSTIDSSNDVVLGQPITVSVSSQSMLFGVSYLFG